MKLVENRLLSAFYANKLRIDWSGETLMTPTLFFTAFRHDILLTIRYTDI